MNRILIEKFQAIVGADNLITDPADMRPYGIDRTTLWEPNPGLVVRPGAVEEVREIVLLANEHNLALVPSGGRTGYAGGAVAKDGEVVVTLERMNRILHFSGADQSVTCEAGVITEHLQEFAAENGLFYAVDLASAGSCRIGGNVATNAGGIHVVRYGGTREQVLGLKVVTGSGEILDLNRGLVKNNCGPDLRHLFIGSEGILGIVCEVTVRLHPQPPPQTVMVVAATEITDLLAVSRQAGKTFTLSAFEFFSQRALDAVTAHTGQQNPFAEPAPVYGLLEFDTPDDEDRITDFFQTCVDNGWIGDGIVGQSIRQARELWQLRENISESLAPRKPLKNDLAVRLEALPAFIERMGATLDETAPELESVWFGHLGDGNIHLNVLKPENWSEEAFEAKVPQLSEAILKVVEEQGGSISAEHGIGLLKREQIGYGLSRAELALNGKLKQAFDPKGILNPGKVL